MKNNRKFKLNFKWLKPVPAVFGILGFLTASLTTTAVALTHNKANTSANINISMVKTTGTNPWTKPSPLPTGNTPKQLLVMPTLDVSQKIQFPTKGQATSTTLYSDVAWLNQTIDNVMTQFNPPASVKTPYQNAASNIWSGLIAGASTALENNFKKAIQDLASTQMANDAYIALNGFPTSTTPTSTKLNIIKPSEIFDIYSSDNPTIAAGTAVIPSDNFAYKVASINISKFKDVNESLSFKVNDLSDPKNTDHDYRLILTNKHKDFEDFENKYNTSNGQFTGPALDYLLQNRAIFVRDASMKAIAAEPDGKTVNKPNDLGQLKDKLFLNLRYDATSKSDFIDVLIKPDDKNADVNTSAVQFQLDASTSGQASSRPAILSYGILDSTHSPLHLKTASNPSEIIVSGAPTIDWGTDPIDPNAKLIDFSSKTNLLKDFDVFSSNVAWKQGVDPINNGSVFNTTRMYLMIDEKINPTIGIKGNTGTNYFESGQNSYELKYSGKSILGMTPTTIQVTKTAIDDFPGVDFSKGIMNRYDFMTIPSTYAQTVDKEYLKLEISLPSDVFTINPISSQVTASEQPYEVPLLDAKIFFEDPFYDTNNSAVFGKTNKDIRTEQQTVIGNLDQELIGDLLSNFSGKLMPTINGVDNKRYIKQNTTVFSRNGNTFPGTFGSATDPSQVEGYANFNEELSTAMGSSTTDTFAYTYDQFAITNSDYTDPTTNVKKTLDILKNIGTITGIYKHDANFNPLDSTGAISTTGRTELNADGKSIYNHFIEYTKAISNWTISRLGLDKSTTGYFDPSYYDLPDVSSSNGFVQTRYIDATGAVGKKLVDVANVIIRVWRDDAMTTSETDLWNEVTTNFGQLITGLDLEIRGKAKLVDKNGKPDPNGSVDESKPDYLRSRQFVYYALQPYFVQVINSLISQITSQFEANMTLSLGSTIRSFLSSTDDAIALKPDLVNKVQSAEYTDASSSLNGMDSLVSLGSYGFVQAADGRESLKSLLDFIENAGLITKYLTDPKEQKLFEQFMQADYLSIPDYFDDPQNQNDLKNFMRLVDRIIVGAFKEKASGFVTFNEIIEKLQLKAYDNGTSALDDLKNSVIGTLKIISKQEKYSTFNFLGVSTDVTYLQSLVMGRNLQSIIMQYIKLHDSQSGGDGTLVAKDKQMLEEFINQNSQFDASNMTNLAIALGYYNLRAFVLALSEESSVVDTAKAMLNSDLVTNIKMNIDSDNQMINFLADPQNFTKFALAGVGGGTFLIGASILGLSFRKSVRSGRKNIILERAIYIGVIVVGIMLAAFGFIPGIL